VAQVTLRLAAVALAAAGFVAALAATGTRPAVAADAPSLPAGASHFDNGPVVSLRPARLAAAAPAWVGGPITASTGEVVRVFVSESLPPESTPQQWADFLASLDHGPELPLLTTYVATLDEVQSTCGDNALGCYGGNQMIVPGETVFDGTTPEEIIRHEYGHHIGRQEAYPGDEGSNYALNPGEAWAETYRILEEQKAGITTGAWQIIAPSFYPTDASLAAAAQDVAQPWTAPTTTLYTRAFTKKVKKAWWIPVQTPLDGDFRLSVTLPRSSEAVVALVAPNRTTVLGRTQWVGQRVKRLTTTICGQRSAFVRVTPSGTVGRIRVSVTKP
jgi:hypothetical protein